MITPPPQAGKDAPISCKNGHKEADGPDNISAALFLFSRLAHSMRMVKQPVKRRKPKKPDNTIGYVVIAIALALVLAVGVFTMMRSGGGPAALQGIGMKDALQQEWQSDFNGFHAIFQTHDNTFQILAIRAQGARYYSRGTYTLNGNAMVLKPDDSLGEPEVKDPSLKFMKLTFGTFTVILQHDGKNLVWNPGPIDPQRAAVNPKHPLIQYSGGDSIIWTPKN